MRVVNENEEEEEEDWSCLTRPPTFFPKKKKEKTRRRRLSRSVVVKTHTQREVGGRIYVHTAQRYIRTYCTIRPGGIGGKSLSLLML